MVLPIAGCVTLWTGAEGELDTAAPARNQAETEEMQRPLPSPEIKDVTVAQDSEEEDIVISVSAEEINENQEENGKNLMANATRELKKNLAMKGFEYAPNESFELLVAYLELQNAYIDGDDDGLKGLKVNFYHKAANAQQMTEEGKLKHLKKLGEDIEVKREEIQEQAKTEIFEVYPTIYVVNKGDSLPSVAARHEVYNDSFMWPLIYKANRDQIKDPKVIYPGQDLKIPRNMTMEEIIEARREAGAPAPEKLPQDAFIPKRKK